MFVSSYNTYIKQKGTKMETKWMMITIMVVIASISAGLSFNSHSNNLANIEAAKAGLEQCPNKSAGLSSQKVIWVKDCKTFLETAKK